MSKSTRTTISVPLELKARMDKVDEPVNWSAVACRAFEAKLAEIIQRRGTKNMSDVVTRLRTSKNRLSGKRYDQGFADGKTWAAETAEAEQLERLATVQVKSGNDWGRLFDSGEGNAYGACERLFFMVNPDDKGDRHAAAAFWEVVAGDDHKTLAQDSDGYVRGFSDGALAVWGEVEDQL